MSQADMGSAKTMHIFFLCDSSGSMQGERLVAQNKAIAYAIQQLQSQLAVVAGNNIMISINVICYRDKAEWHFTNQPLERLSNWPEVKQAYGITNLGQAYKLLASRLKILSSEPKQLNPTLILISDGKPTDDDALGLEFLLRTRLGNQASRLAFGIGGDADIECLNRFDDQAQAEIVHNLRQFKHQLARGILQAVHHNYLLAQSGGEILK